MKGVDKIILGVGVLALAGALAWFFLTGGGAVKPNISGGDIAYESLQQGRNPVKMANWVKPGPIHEDKDSIFEVFTPPKIYFNPTTGEFDFEQPQPPKVFGPFGVELLEITRVAHRIQYNGSVKLDADNYLVIFKNSETGDTVRGRVGKSFAGQDQFTITKYVKKSEMVGGILQEDVSLEFRDDRDGKTYASNGVDQIFTEDYTLTLRTTVAPIKEFTWKAVGDTFSFSPADPVGEQAIDPQATYTLVGFDAEKKVAGITKSASYLDEDAPDEEKRQQFKARGAPAPTPAPVEDKPKPASSGADDFNNLFNNL